MILNESFAFINSGKRRCFELYNSVLRGLKVVGVISSYESYKEFFQMAQPLQITYKRLVSSHSRG